MPGKYAGHLRADDPLHGYLSHHVLPDMGVTAQQVDFRVFCLKKSKVYRYEESHSRAQVVGKFFVNGSRRGSVVMKRMRREFENLQVLRGYGLAGYPHHVVRPLGTNESLNSILVEEYCGGAPLSAFIDAAIHREQQPQLFAKLTALAYFLATLHNRTANGHSVDFSEDCAYLDRLVKNLESKHIIGAWVPKSFIGCGTFGGRSPVCGRTGRFSCMATPPPATSCLVTASTSWQSISNE
jgi:hypothetical protein